MTIGVAVEGPSDYEFWNKVLRKSFPHPVEFDIRNLKSSGNLIREAPRLLRTFRDARYEAGFFLLDYDVLHRGGNPCPGAIVDLFDEAVRTEATLPLEERFLFVCIAVKGLESWYLADQDAVLSLLPGITYTAPEDTGNLAGAMLQQLWSQSGQNRFRKIDFARQIASRFRPEVAVNHSRSFRHFWERIMMKAGPVQKVPQGPSG